jgi:drug/metabolite transporter (DMT)-like permease
VSATLALLSSLLWGTSDFLGGTASRRLPPYLVVGWADVMVTLALVAIGLGLGDLHLSAPLIGWAGGAGLVGLVGIGAFYRALADGAMGVVAPIAGLGVAVPIAVGIGQGDRPHAVQVTGIVVAVIAIVLVSSTGASLPGAQPGGPHAGRILMLAAVAAVSFGTVFVFLDEAEPYGTVATLLLMRVLGLAVLMTAAALTRTSVAVAPSDLPLIGTLGAFDVGANACFQLATDSGALAIVAVLSSLYPAVTAVLARVVHDERLSRRQLVGAALTVAAIGLLAAGPAG